MIALFLLSGTIFGLYCLNSRMKTKLLSPTAHCVTDFALVGSLFILPSALKLNKQVKRVYATEAIGLLAYAALTKSSLALRPLIPLRTHARVDPLKVAFYALQTFTKPFRRQKKAMLFNVIFTTLAAASVLLANWNAQDK